MVRITQFLPKIFALLLLGLLLQACSDDASPEAQIREFPDAGIEAAENRSTDDLHDMLHLDYRDHHGHNRKRLIGFLRLYFLKHKNIHLFSKINKIDVINDNQASVSMHVAMAGSAISSIDALVGLSARIYRFELELIKDDEWQLQHASWSPASLGDLQ